LKFTCVSSAFIFEIHLCFGFGQLADVEIERHSGAASKTRFPGAPFLVGAGLVLIALFVAFSLPGEVLKIN
jgi:hypothetical protein